MVQESTLENLSLERETLEPTQRITPWNQREQYSLFLDDSELSSEFVWS